MAYTYKSKDGSEYVIPGVGRSSNGVITSETKLENPNLELIETTEQPAQAPIESTSTPVAQPAAIIGVAPVATVATTLNQPTEEQKQ